MTINDSGKKEELKDEYYRDYCISKLNEWQIPHTEGIPQLNKLYKLVENLEVLHREDLIKFIIGRYSCLIQRLNSESTISRTNNTYHMVHDTNALLDNVNNLILDICNSMRDAICEDYRLYSTGLLNRLIASAPGVSSIIPAVYLDHTGIIGELTETHFPKLSSDSLIKDKLIEILVRHLKDNGFSLNFEQIIKITSSIGNWEEVLSRLEKMTTNSNESARDILSSLLAYYREIESFLSNVHRELSDDLLINLMVNMIHNIEGLIFLIDDKGNNDDSLPGWFDDEL